MACSPTTVKTAWDRWQNADQDQRQDFSCLLPRRPIPRTCPWSLSVEAEQQILAARAKTGWGEMRLSVLCGGRHRSSIGKVLRRHGVSRLPKEPRSTSRRYEWAEAGALLHFDALRLAKFDRPGHWATGQRAEKDRTRQAGTTFVLGVVDDHTRLAYCELHSSESAVTVTATLRRAIVWFAEQGCGPVQAVMSDNRKAYTSHKFTALLSELGAKQILTPAYTPRWNGKIERFFLTAKREWSHGRVWQNSTNATAPCHRSCATTTANAPTAPPAADHPSPASTKTASRTPRAPPKRRRAQLSSQRRRRRCAASERGPPLLPNA